MRGKRYILIIALSAVIIGVIILVVTGQLRQRPTGENPRSKPRAIAEQPFEKGNMYWVQLPDWFFVTIGGDEGAWYMQAQSEITWPWNPGTLRGFASTLILPVFLRYVYQLVENLF